MNDLQLEKYRNDLVYLKAMADQTVKDFDRFNYSVIFNDALPIHFNNYRSQLAEQLKSWCKFDSDRMPGLLYHIDVPEHLLQARYGCRDADQMADLILRRELIKVILRKHYSS